MTKNEMRNAEFRQMTLAFLLLAEFGLDLSDANFSDIDAYPDDEGLSPLEKARAEFIAEQQLRIRTILAIVMHSDFQASIDKLVEKINDAKVESAPSIDIEIVHFPHITHGNN